MKELLAKVCLIARLGIVNVLRVVVYRVTVRTGMNPVRRLQESVPVAPFFVPTNRGVGLDLPARSGWYGSMQAFGVELRTCDGVAPDWLSNCFTGVSVPDANRKWWQIPDFDAAVGDIKTVWEASRFDWVLACAEQHLVGNDEALPRLEAWLSDWLEVNPPYRGPNWKCGQEASIRVMHLSMAALLLGEITTAREGLLQLIRMHLKRIAPTIQYAIAQDNNHGTSEAAALFIGGSWLASMRDQQGDKWMRTGRKWLENRAARLIESDGSFSQYSVNYHRVMLDTYSMAELWRQRLGLPVFSDKLYTKVTAAMNWLRSMTSEETGDAPNLGANDGARLLPLTDTDYRDYRPSVQLAAVLFAHSRAYAGVGGWNFPLQWLGITVPELSLPEVESQQCDEGGYAVLRSGNAMAMLNYPRFRFRPSQADALHLDLWVGGENWLRDAGTYAYNTDARWLDYFPGTSAHNTVAFDGRDQMPRISRFLFGCWLKSTIVQSLESDGEKASFEVAYCDKQRCRHQRRVELDSTRLRVVDHVSGFQNNAVLRWRLRPGNWRADPRTGRVSCAGMTIYVEADAPITRFALVDGWESRYYWHKSQLPVLEIEMGTDARLISTFEWSH